MTSALAQTATTTSVNKIAGLEVRIFAHPYSSEKLPQRVARLERFVYGQEDSSSLDERINRLTSHLSSSANSVCSAEMPMVQKPVPQPNAAHTVTKYPRVTELERQILERSFESDQITTRLSRLESKVFGGVCSQVDLAARVDRLADYAYVTPQVEELERAELCRVSNLRNTNYPINVNNVSNVSYPHIFRNPSSVGNLRNVTSPQNISNLQYVSARPKQVFISIVDEIESLETMAFGKISASKPLAQRVYALEVSFCGAPQSDNEKNLTARVALLLSKVNSASPGRLGV
jgi:hypothetical protein